MSRPLIFVSLTLNLKIRDAKKQLILVSPYLKLTSNFFERIKDATGRGVEVIIIYGKDDLEPNQKNSLAKLEKITLLFFKNLHAKCYLNETHMVITSMNMYEFSEKNNREMGILIDKVIDSRIYEKAVEEVQSIAGHSERIPLLKTERNFQNQFNSTPKANQKAKDVPPALGYCIRCEDRVPYDPSRPYCWSCYQVWAQYENYGYKETFCHCCGEFNNTVTISASQCYKCTKKFPRPTM